MRINIIHVYEIEIFMKSSIFYGILHIFMKYFDEILHFMIYEILYCFILIFKFVYFSYKIY